MKRGELETPSKGEMILEEGLNIQDEKKRQPATVQAQQKRLPPHLPPTRKEEVATSRQGVFSEDTFPRLLKKLHQDRKDPQAYRGLSKEKLFRGELHFLLVKKRSFLVKRKLHTL